MGALVDLSSFGWLNIGITARVRNVRRVATSYAIWASGVKTR